MIEAFVTADTGAAPFFSTTLAEIALAASLEVLSDVTAKSSSVEDNSNTYCEAEMLAVSTAFKVNVLLTVVLSYVALTLTR